MKRKLVSIILSITIICSVLSLPTVSAQAPRYSTISGGTLHSAAIQNDGSLWTWGYNSDGALAVGHTDGVLVPTKVMDNVASVSAGEWTTAMLKNDGSVWMVGGNIYGQLGNGTTTSTTKPVKVMDNVRFVQTAGFFTAAIKNDDSLWIWGDTFEGEILTPTKIMDGVESFSTGGWHHAVIKKDKSLWMWGFNTTTEIGAGYEERISTPVKIMDNVASVSLGSRHSAVIKPDGSLWMWGHNEFGYLGNGTTKNSGVPVKIMDNVVSVSLGDDHSAAIKKDGSLWMWGRNWNGELGNGEQEDIHVPIKIMDNVVAVDLGNNHALAITSDGRLWTWGANRSGQAGLGHTEYAVRYPTNIMDNMMMPDKMVSDVIVQSPTNTTETFFGSAVSDWAIDEIECAYDNGLIPESLVGADLTQKVNRSEFAAIAMQLYEDLIGGFDTETQKYCNFSDIAGDKNEYAIIKAYEAEITTGTSETTYEPLSFINREQLATILCRVIKKYLYPMWTISTDSEYYMDISGVTKFKDDADISDWAKESVYYMSKHDIIKGVSNTHFAPKNTNMQQEMSGYASATREQAIIITQRIFMNSHKFN